MPAETRNGVDAKMNSDGCRLCGSAYRRLLYKINTGYAIFRCSKCSLIYAISSSPTQLNHKSLYSKDYFAGTQNQGFSAYILHKDIIDKNSEYRITNIERHKKNGCILDVGCAMGFFLEVARKNGWKVFGAEVSGAAAQYCREKFDIPVFIMEEGDKGEPLPREYFDVITMYDVIEHAEKPVKLLSQIYRSLKPEGIVIIETPDVESIYAKLLQGRSPYIRPPAHLSYFSRSTLRKILCDTGFTVEILNNARKIVNISYLINVLETNNKIMAKVLRLLSCALGNLKHKPMSLYLGGIYVLGRKRA